MDFKMALFHEITDFLLPYMDDMQKRKALIEPALHGCHVLPNIDWTGSTYEFTVRIVQTLLNFGECEPGKPAVVLLLEAMKQHVGFEKHPRIEALIQSARPIMDGSVIAGRYQLLHRMGDKSGQAEVWQAQDMHDAQVPPVVVKCVKPHPSRDYESRFKEEVRSVRELEDHPHIVRIYDYGVDHGLCYLVMPTLRGSLKALIDEQKRILPADVLYYLTQIADALDFAHSHQIIHRDLKPANLLFTRETNKLCLADFGISYRAQREAPITGTGETAATEEYAAPEQLREHGQATPQSDIYALAIIAYELLTGSRPFTGSKSEVAAAQLDPNRLLPEHAHLTPPVLKALRVGAAKDPAHRPKTAGDFVKLLDDALAGKSPDVLMHYLNVTLPAHLAEVGGKLAKLEKAFVDLSADILEQEVIENNPVPLDPELADDEFVPDWEDDASLEIELHGELYTPREHFTGEVIYTPNIRERIKSLKRVVLLGEPGAGKTFMLARLALDYRDTDLVPVFVPLSKYDTVDDFETFVAARLGTLAARLPELEVIWLLDALNEMPREQGQWKHLKTFIDRLVETDKPFVLTCRVKNYEQELAHVPHLHRVDLQDLNPQQIFDILKYFLTEEYARKIWLEVMHGENLLEAWAAWTGSVREFWEMPEDWWRDNHKKARNAVHQDPRKLMLLCRNPFTLVRLLVSRMYQAIAIANQKRQPLAAMLEKMLPKNRASLFGQVIADMLKAETERQGWNADEVKQMTAMLEYTAAALQAQQQRTEITLTELLNQPDTPPDGIDLLKMGRDAGLVTLSDSGVRFNHQLFQEYFATKRLRDLLEDYDRRYPAWADGSPLPPRDERLAELFPDWWEVGGWRVTVTLLGELEGRTGISRVVRWLASYAPEIALNVVLDNNDDVTLDTLPDEARQSLIEGAQVRSDEQNPVGRAAAYRVLGLFDADHRPGIGLRLDGLPDIDWLEIPGGNFIYGDDNKEGYPDYAKPADRQELDLPTFSMSRYPVTYRQFQAFINAQDGFYNPLWWDGLADDEYRRKNQSQPGEQAFKFWNHPRETVSWYDAIAFCRWLSAKLGGGYDLNNVAAWAVRLPTEFEWEKAARGTDGRLYPYGNEFDVAKGNTYETSIGQTSAVGIFPNGVSPYGLHDMSGNVWEWCLSDYKNPQIDLLKEVLINNENRSQRGGSWSDNPDFARSVFRGNDHPFFRNFNFGFRLLRPPSQ